MAFPFEQYMVSVGSAKRSYPHWRYGQVLFNVLHDGWPDIANSIRATELDPFHYDDERESPITDFLEHLSSI